MSIASVDDSVGTILDTLERMGELDNTVVVVTSDHGYFYGEHGLGGERRLAYEETSRIPMMIRNPGHIEAGTKVDELVPPGSVVANFHNTAGWMKMEVL